MIVKHIKNNSDLNSIENKTNSLERYAKALSSFNVFITVYPILLYVGFKSGSFLALSFILLVFFVMAGAYLNLKRDTERVTSELIDKVFSYPTKNKVRRDQAGNLVRSLGLGRMKDVKKELLSWVKLEKESNSR